MRVGVKILFLALFITNLATAQVATVSDSSFNKEVLASSAPVIMKSFTPFCGECQDMAPHFSRASNKALGCKFVELNTIHNSQVRNNFGIALVPTTLIFKNGKVVYRHVGLLTESELVTLAKKHCS